MILMSNAEFIFFLYTKKFVELEDVYSARCYPLMETN
jgi:hypothetical protein